jgi:uncharacterized membrane protein
MDYLPFETAPVSQPRGIRWQRVALVFVFLWFSIGGTAHCVATDSLAGIVPPGLPSPRVLVSIGGAFELLGAFGLILARTRRAAGWGLIALTLAATAANVHLLQVRDPSAPPEWLPWARLALQLPLLWLIRWGSRWRPVRRLY